MRALLVILSLSSALASAGVDPAAPDSAAITAITASPANLRIKAGEQAHLIVTAKLADGFETDATETAKFTAGERLKVEGTGIIRAVSTGTRNSSPS
jgi:hypothetical protein